MVADDDAAVADLEVSEPPRPHLVVEQTTGQAADLRPFVDGISETLTGWAGRDVRHRVPPSPGSAPVPLANHRVGRLTPGPGSEPGVAVNADAEIEPPGRHRDVGATGTKSAPSRAAARSRSPRTLTGRATAPARIQQAPATASRRQDLPCRTSSRPSGCLATRPGSQRVDELDGRNRAAAQYDQAAAHAVRSKS